MLRREGVSKREYIEGLGESKSTMRVPIMHIPIMRIPTLPHAARQHAVVAAYCGRLIYFTSPNPPRCFSCLTLLSAFVRMSAVISSLDSPTTRISPLSAHSRTKW